MGILNVIPPQRGKTFSIISEFLKYAQRGDTLVYSVSSHSESASIIKHYVTVQRMYNWGIRSLLIVYAGLNRWCPLYKEIREERSRLGIEYKQNVFCRENCELWKMSPIGKGLFEPGTRGIYLERRVSLACKITKQCKGKNTITHGPIRIILNDFNYWLLSKLYEDIYSSIDFNHHTLVLTSRDRETQYNTPIFVKGCIRAFIMRKLIDSTRRDRKGRVKGKDRRSVYGYPTILVIPHHLLPLALHFARIYSNRIFVVVDEFDRILNIKVPRYLAERYKNLPKPKEWSWKSVLETYNVLEQDRGEQSYNNTLAFRFELKKELNPETGRKTVKEVPLLTLVDLELKKLKEKGKLSYIGVLGSSIPLLPFQILKYLIEWLKDYFNDILLLYDYLSIPEQLIEDKRIVIVNDKKKERLVYRTVDNIDLKLLKKGTLVVVGSRSLALNLVRKVIQVNGSQYKLEFNIPVDLVELNKYLKGWCKQQGYIYNSNNYTCISKSGKRALLLYFNYTHDMTRVKQVNIVKWYLNRDLVEMNGRYVTWLGGRITRGVTLSRKIKRMIIATSSKANETIELFGEKMKTEVLRTLDMLQILFRINSRPDLMVAVTPYATVGIEYTIKWYNKHVSKLVELVEDTTQ